MAPSRQATCPASAAPRPYDPHQLTGAERRAWEEKSKAAPGLKGRSSLLLRVLLDMAYGKPWAYPSDAYLARKASVSVNTAGRGLADLVRLEIIRIVHVRGRRWIVLLSHPQAAAFLATIHPSPPRRKAPNLGCAVPQLGGGIVEPLKTEAESLVADNAIDPPSPNDSTREERAPLAAEERADIIAWALAVPAVAQDDPPAAIPAPVDANTAQPPRSHHEPVTAPSAPVDAAALTYQALAKLGPGATKGERHLAAYRLASLLNDPRSKGFYIKTVGLACQGELPVSALPAALRSAMGKDVRKPGAAFTAHIKRCQAVAARRRDGP